MREEVRGSRFEVDAWRQRGFLTSNFEPLPSLGLRDLSMGMTDDFEVAIEEGATIVRVGRAIFGERQ